MAGRPPIAVRKGDAVTAGAEVGRCGNSGNSTEPHVHIQVMDRASVWIAAGLPLPIGSEDLPANGDTVRYDALTGAELAR